MAGSVNYYRCTFAFSSEWQELSKFAVFMCGDEVYTVMLEGDSCFIPCEMLSTAGTIAVGVYGSSMDEEKPLRISTDFSHIVIKDGAYREGTTPAVPQADLWEVYFKRAAEQTTQVAVDAAIAAADSAKAEIDMLNVAAVAELEKHTVLSDNPHRVTATQIGLGNVDNTPDSKKNVAYAQEAWHADSAGIADSAGSATFADFAYADWNGNTLEDWYATKQELNTAVGNIEAALDGIITVQNTLIGGDAV